MVPESHPVTTAGSLGNADESSSVETFTPVDTSDVDTDLDCTEYLPEKPAHQTDTARPHRPDSPATHLGIEDPQRLACFIWGLDQHTGATPSPKDPIFRHIIDEITKATRTAMGPHGADAAAEWGDGFDFDRQITTQHAEWIEKASPNPRAALAEAGRTNWIRLNDGSPGRLNETRVASALSHTNPHLANTLLLAADGGGVRVPVPPDFRPNCAAGGQPPRLPGNTATVGGALRKMIHQAIIEPGLGFVLTMTDARRLIPDLHVSPCAWAPKDATASGRNCINCSNGGRLPGNSPLNSEDLRTWMRARWGHLVLPTIEDLVCMVIDFHASHTSPSDPDPRITIWKMDIKGAYTLLTFHPADLHLVGCLLPGDYVVIPQGGTFGWTGMPFVFNVITQAIIWELNNGRGTYRLAGRALMYVDDIFGVTLAPDLIADMSKAQRLIETLLGDHAVATKKTESTETALDVIGYRIDIARQRVGITERNRHKAFAAIWALGDGQSVSVRQLQRVASHASRYKRVVPLIAPYTNTLHKARSGYTNKNARLRLSKRQMNAVWMVRALLIVAVTREKDFTRTFTSFNNQQRDPQWAIEYDASLEGIGLIWFERKNSGAEIAVGGCAVNLTRWKWEKKGSGMMNFVEFLAGTIGIKALADRGIRNVAIKVRGDNKAAMKWAKDKTFRSDRAGRVAVGHVMLTARAGIDVVAAEHLPHGKHYDWNWRADWLSRGKTMMQVRAQDAQDPPSRLGEEWIEWEVEGLDEWVTLCDPLREEEGDEEFIHHMSQLTRHIHQ